MNKYKVLIVGLGGQGLGADLPESGNEHKIISFAHAFDLHEGFEIIGACDPDEEKRNLAEKYYGIKTYTKLRECKEQFDVAVVATPDNYHYSILMQLAERKPKLVICEKPICEDLKQAKTIVELYKTKGIALMVNYTRRFLPYYDYLKEHGKPLFGICNFNRGWLHTATHGIDFFNMIGLKDYKILEHKVEPRIWQLMIWFENGIVFKEERFEGDPVWGYYDKSHWYIAENAYNFLGGKEPLKCTGEIALKALEICYKLMKGEKNNDRD